mmetsp:Transcript_3706/g.9162  ORF Transcript_3706/g.9162 Transcript_3706/m.9162 type:complete len:164 (-) Transcript_3706:54-545(-)|eukprot:752420-Hanusia_phi.AAC.2
MEQKSKSKAANNLVDRYLRRRILRFESLIPESIHRSYVSNRIPTQGRTASDSSGEGGKANSSASSPIPADALDVPIVSPGGWPELFVIPSLPLVPPVPSHKASWSAGTEKRMRSQDVPDGGMEQNQAEREDKEHFKYEYSMCSSLFEEALEHIEQSSRGKRRR